VEDAFHSRRVLKSLVLIVLCFGLTVTEWPDQQAQSQASGMRQEVAQRDACERFIDALVRSGYEVQPSLFAGAHDFRCWASELPAALAWLLK
jgi:S-formylglutathione hydrolase FrmB